ncbi:hypothetical protein A8924_1827 [Saccharopolyspora erythraea NRRL 2338]|uniref:Uncharacterized protein n=2 Tax=Saccharopolyspora erythraea TaxID=1836 RepID=A4F9M7_SACEN|nr:hypothetical protein [Saccharopolyspora erythraea]EQD87319.1 hypothetical protein N599_04570 [Saccharopolyspora erythraea D]PFG94539.1 hypothetical protein A8924_1827 [Saccharopolyspora erythraea NRRL 2338]QRK91287.1 hypothetical protein JQX30_07705 [Saccharopolyspora erythraea]CAM00752.1 hypothetical protein SACE_1430 [Saccharopolyspora erythraea NRRL 2338]
MATKQRKSTTVEMPGVTAEVHQPDHYIPTRDDLAGAANAVRSYLPSGRTMAFYGGLGALAAFSMIEWPVAAAIGLGVAVAQRGGSQEKQSS